MYLPSRDDNGWKQLEVSMLSDFLELLLYPLLLFIVPFVAVVVMLGINDYMDSKEGKDI
jgi:hypothetical protein